MPTIRAPRWTPPPPSFVKINVDRGIAKNASKGVAAVICRDSQGIYLGSSTRVIDDCMDPRTLEAMACSEALSLAADLNLHSLVIACDATQVINQIKAESKGIYGSIPKEIDIRSRTIIEVRFIHEGRTSNTSP